MALCPLREELDMDEVIYALHAAKAEGDVFKDQQGEIS